MFFTIRNASTLLGLAGCVLFSGFAAAQTPQAPAPIYTGTLGGGFALTSGNTDTKNFNLAFALVRDPKTRDVLKVDASYLRGSQNDVLSLDRSSVRVRNEHIVSNRLFLYGEMDYLRDEFKDIRYLLAPGGGLGYNMIKTDTASFSISGGAGGVWEKNSGLSVKSSGSVSVGESLSRKLSSTATITQSVGTLWKTNDFGDSLTNFAIGLTSSLTSRLELKVEFLDSYKNKPPNAAIKKNDTAFVTAFVVKF